MSLAFTLFLSPRHVSAAVFFFCVKTTFCFPLIQFVIYLCTFRRLKLIASDTVPRAFSIFFSILYTQKSSSLVKIGGKMHANDKVTSLIHKNFFGPSQFHHATRLNN